ncbi:unnamed protein product [Cochlearia groenlandica]
MPLLMDMETRPMLDPLYDPSSPITTAKQQEGYRQAQQQQQYGSHRLPNLLSVGSRNSGKTVETVLNLRFGQPANQNQEIWPRMFPLFPPLLKDGCSYIK